MSEDPDLTTVASLLDDEYARDILTATSVEPMSATELTDCCDASLPTVYRRVERLEAADLLDEQTRPRKDGHHDTVYVATLDSLQVTLTEGEFDFDLTRTERDPADELAKLWSKL